MSPAFESLVSRFHFFQTAYAVSDLDQAMRVAGRLYGVPQFQVTRDVPIQMSAGIAHCHFALAFLGATQIELIRPAGGIFEREGVALMHYLYADTTATLGHHLEFMHETPAGRSIFAQVPRYALRNSDADLE